MMAGLLGAIVTPMQGNKAPAGAAWCADNGAYGRGFPGELALFRWMVNLPYDRSLCQFAAAPDVVGDAAATLERSRPWLSRIRRLGMPAALVAQNGLEYLAVPWDEFDVLFLGGCVECDEHGPTLSPIKRGTRRFFCPVCEAEIFEWKLSAAARKLVAEARRRGKRVHCGRVNSRVRLQYAKDIGCDSVDGTYIAFGPTKNLARMTRWLAEVNGS